MVVALVFLPQRQGLQRHDERRQSHGELREKVVIGNGKGEMQSMYEFSAVHVASPGLNEIIADRCERETLRFEPLQFTHLFRLADFAPDSRVFIPALFVLGLRQHRRHLEFAPMAVHGNESQVSAADDDFARSTNNAPPRPLRRPPARCERPGSPTTATPPGRRHDPARENQGDRWRRSRHSCANAGAPPALAARSIQCISRPPSREPSGLASLGRTNCTISEADSATGFGLRNTSNLLFAGSCSRFRCSPDDPFRASKISVMLVPGLAPLYLPASLGAPARTTAPAGWRPRYAARKHLCLALQPLIPMRVQPGGRCPREFQHSAFAGRMVQFRWRRESAESPVPRPKRKSARHRRYARLEAMNSAHSRDCTASRLRHPVALPGALEPNSSPGKRRPSGKRWRQGQRSASCRCSE